MKDNLSHIFAVINERGGEFYYCPHGNGYDLKNMGKLYFDTDEPNLLAEPTHIIKFTQIISSTCPSRVICLIG